MTRSDSRAEQCVATSSVGGSGGIASTGSTTRGVTVLTSTTDSARLETRAGGTSIHRGS